MDSFGGGGGSFGGGGYMQDGGGFGSPVTDSQEKKVSNEHFKKINVIYGLPSHYRSFCVWNERIFRILTTSP